MGSEMRNAILLDGFYEPLQEEAFNFVKKWTDENDTLKWKDENGVEQSYSDFDRRWIGFSFSKEGDPDKGAVLDSLWDKYYDSSEKYNKLVAVKNRFDPKYLFTANTFGIDATRAHKARQAEIYTTDEFDAQR